MLYFVIYCLWLEIYSSSNNKYDENWINKFEKSLIYKSFEAVQKLPDLDFENILKKLVIFSKFECSQHIFQECLLFRKNISEVYFGKNCNLSKKIIFNIYTDKQDFEEDTCYYGANFLLISNFINIWVDFYQNEEIWIKNHNIKFDEIQKVYLFEKKFNHVQEYYNIELRIEPMTWLPKYVKLVFYEYLIFILKFSSRIDFYKNKLGNFHRYTDKITSLKKSYLEDIYKFYSLQDKVLVRFSSFSYMQSTVFNNPFDFAKKSSRFNPDNTDIKKCCLKSTKLKIDKAFMTNLKLENVNLIFESENELEFYFQILHFLAEVYDLPIFISLKKVEQEFFVRIENIDFIPFDSIFCYVKNKNDRTEEFINGNISKDICIEYNDKNKIFVKYNGRIKNNSQENKNNYRPCLGLSCGHCLGSKNLIAKLYVDINHYALDNDTRISRCPICFKRVKAEYAVKHYD